MSSASSPLAQSTGWRSRSTANPGGSTSTGGGIGAASNSAACSASTPMLTRWEKSSPRRAGASPSPARAGSVPTASSMRSTPVVSRAGSNSEKPAPLGRNLDRYEAVKPQAQLEQQDAEGQGAEAQPGGDHHGITGRIGQQGAPEQAAGNAAEQQQVPPVPLPQRGGADRETHPDGDGPDRHQIDQAGQRHPGPAIGGRRGDDIGAAAD